MFWSKEEFRTVIWHTKITCKITQKVVLPVLVLRVRWKNTIKIEKKIVNKRHYLDLLNEGPGEGGLDRAMALSLSVVLLAGCLRFFLSWALMILARAIDITSAGAPASIQETKLREKSEKRNEMREKRSEWGFSSREEAEREEWNDGCFVRPTYCWKGGGFVIWRLIGHYCGGSIGLVYRHSTTE